MSLIKLTLRIPPKSCQYIRCYVLYASRTKGKRADKPHVVRLAPAGWNKQQQQPDQDVQPYEAEATCSFFDKESHSMWAKFIAQVYEVDPLVCPRCSAAMRILAVVTEPEEVCKILRHLVKIGRSPPGLDPTSFAHAMDARRRRLDRLRATKIWGLPAPIIKITIT